MSGTGREREVGGRGGEGDEGSEGGQGGVRKARKGGTMEMIRESGGPKRT